MAREDLHFRLRLPEYLKELVEQAAAEHGHSMTAEIVQRLHTSFDEDHATLKLPKSLQDRIRFYAERQHRSLNAEIVRILEREFPAPTTLADRVGEILGLLSNFREIENVEHAVAVLGFELYETLDAIATGRIKGVDAEVREKIRERLAEWKREQAENDLLRYTETMDDEEIEAVHRGEHPFKFNDDVNS